MPQFSVALSRSEIETWSRGIPRGSSRSTISLYSSRLALTDRPAKQSIGRSSSQPSYAGASDFLCIYRKPQVRCLQPYRSFCAALKAYLATGRSSAVNPVIGRRRRQHLDVWPISHRSVCAERSILCPLTGADPLARMRPLQRSGCRYPRLTGPEPGRIPTPGSRTLVWVRRGDHAFMGRP
jgi:hypothetical protein